MGQYWKLVNIAKRAELLIRGGLKMQEMIGNRVGEKVIDLLLVKNLPPFGIKDEDPMVVKTKW